jgi:hypothetical protein
MSSFQLLPTQNYPISQTGIPEFTVDNSMVAIGFYRGARMDITTTVPNSIGFSIDISLVSTTSLSATITNIGNASITFEQFYLTAIWFSQT